MKRTPDDCPAEAVFENTPAQQLSKRLKTGQTNDNFKVTLCNHWLSGGSCPSGDECLFAHGEDEVKLGLNANIEFLNDSDIYDPSRGRMGSTLELPFPEKSRFSFFMLQSPDLRSLVVSKRRGVWAIPARMAAEVNAAFRHSDHVLLYFCVRPLRGLYGVAKMAGGIPPSSGGGITSEFPVLWLRTTRIPLSTVAQLKLGSTGMFLGRSTTDGRFDNRVGLELLWTFFRKPMWDWPSEIEIAERNIRLVDKGISNQSEYYPTGGRPAYYLPENVLFAPDWIERAGLPVNEKGILINSFHRGNAQGGGFQGGMNGPVSNPVVPDFYGGLLPGFIACATPPIIEEMFHRMMIGMPLMFKDAPVKPDAPLFIFDTVANMMLGVFLATSELKLNAEPLAFFASLPVQVTFRPAFEGPPVHLPIADPELLQALGESIQTMGLIGIQETKNLVTLFTQRFQQSQMRNRRPPMRRNFF